MKISFLAWLWLFGTLVWSAEQPPLFSSLMVGQALPREFRIIALPKVARNNFSLGADDGQTVLQVESSGSSGSLGMALMAPASAGGPGAASRVLQWRWKISRALQTADMQEKSADDHAARVYVFFDVPLASLSFAERNKIKLARLLLGTDVPTAALCYVWDNRHRIGYSAWSPYTQRMRKIVLQSGSAHAGQWMSEARDVAADFRETFGFDAPAVTGIAVGNDTDNTDESVTTWFGDISFRP
jgi:hypothetical protein